MLNDDKFGNISRLEKLVKYPQMHSNMILPNESILHSLPTNKIGEKELYWFEAIISITRMLEISYSRLFDLIITNEQNIATESLNIESWNIIDNFNRLYCILSRCPRIKKKSPWIKLILNDLKEVENARHFIQHYDREIDNLHAQTLPPLGYLCYAIKIDTKKIQTRTVVPGYVRKYSLQTINPVGKDFKMDIDLITYFIGNHTIQLSKLLYKTQEFVKELENFIKKEYLEKNTS